MQMPPLKLSITAFMPSDVLQCWCIALLPQFWFHNGPITPKKCRSLHLYCLHSIHPGAVSIQHRLSRYRIPIGTIRRSRDRLICIMGFLLPLKQLILYWNGPAFSSCVTRIYHANCWYPRRQVVVLGSVFLPVCYMSIFIEAFEQHPLLFNDIIKQARL